MFRVPIQLAIYPPQARADFQGVLARAADGLRFFDGFIDDMAAIDESDPELDAKAAAAVNRLYEGVIVAFPTSGLLRAAIETLASAAGRKAQGH